MKVQRFMKNANQVQFGRNHKAALFDKRSELSETQLVPLHQLIFGEKAF